MEGITAGDFVRELSSLGMCLDSIIPSNTKFLKGEEKRAYERLVPGSTPMLRPLVSASVGTNLLSPNR